MLQTGMILRGRHTYRLLAKIGNGGVSDVWLVRQGNSRRIRAMKVARYQHGNDAFVSHSFSVEKHALRTLHIPDIPRLTESFDMDGVPVLVLEYVSGMSMDRYLREKGPMSEEQTVSVITSICRILKKIHAKGIVYRDLKPSNIMMRNDGGISLIDFGSVYCIGSSAVRKHCKVGIPDSAVREHCKVGIPDSAAREHCKVGIPDSAERESRMVGTPGYAAPELYHAEKCPDGRADIYSLGALIRAMRQGGRRGETETAKRLFCIMERCMREDPDERYASVDEILRDLHAENFFASETAAHSDTAAAPDNYFPPDTAAAPENHFPSVIPVAPENHLSPDTPAPSENTFFAESSLCSDTPVASENTAAIFWKKAMGAALVLAGILSASGLISYWRMRDLAGIRCSELLERAAESSDATEKLKLLSRAAELPGDQDREDIRMQMIRVCGEDGKLSENETTLLETLVSGRTSVSDRSAVILFEVGRLYWYCSTYDGEDQMERAADAAEWFEQARGALPSYLQAEEENVVLSENRDKNLNRQRAAEAYAGACWFYRCVASDVNLSTAGGEYRSFAKDLADIATYEAGRTDQFDEAVHLTDIILDAEKLYCDSFRADGVSEDDLQAIWDAADGGD